MKKMLLSLLLPLALFIAQPARAALGVFACEPEWAALAQELGGSNVAVYGATQALQDPHRVEARPSLIARARNAALAVCSGAELEAGWLPVVLREASNPAIRPGARGYFEAAQYVSRLEIPKRIDRADGDVHPEGNPHVHLDPRNLLAVAAPLAQRLAELDPAHAADYAARHKVFAARMSAAISRWEREAAPLKGVPVVVHHKSFAYLINWLGLREVASLEPKPGIEPSGAHLARLLAQMKAQPARVILRSAYEPARPSEWLAERAGLPALMLPYTVGGSERATDLVALFDDTLGRLLAAVRP